MRVPRGMRVPRTPVRWLCLKAFSYLALSSGRRLEPRQWDAMCQTIELGIFLNRCFDGKTHFSAFHYRRLRRGLPEPVTRDYLRKLRQAESGRPRGRDWPSVMAYRRAVLELSLDALFRLAELPPRPVLLPLTFLIQLVDDILDQRLDRQLGLPTLLTAQGPPAHRQARELWGELKTHRQPQDRPIVALGFLVYFLARLAARLIPAS